MRLFAMIIALSALLPALTIGPVWAQEGADRPRVIVTADPELDDNNSLIRYLLYATDFRTEGLIYASSQFHWRGDGEGTRWYVDGHDQTGMCPCTSYRWNPEERFIDDAVDAYEEAYPNLSAHSGAYPSPEDLRSVIRWGNVDFDGDLSADTPGSDLIRSVLLDDDPAPVYLLVWGGASTVARALRSIQETYQDSRQWRAIRSRVNEKAVILPSGDQDGTLTGYIASNWPDIAVRTNAGGVPLGYNNEPRVSVEDAIYFSPSWTQENISQRGPLGALYRVWGDGRPDQSGGLFDPLDFFGPEGLSADELRAMGYIVWTTVREPGAFTGEGDTGTFLNLIDNGFRGFELDTYGGWGGYRSLAPVMMFPPARGGAASEPDANSAMMAGLFATGPRAPNAHPFLAAAQRDFAARLRWATTPSFADANHEPTISVAGERVRRVRSERPVRLAVTTSDPDGDRVAVRWWQWLEAGSVVAPVEIDGDGETATVTVSGDALSGQTVHIIAEATDADGLVRYARIVLIVR